MHRPVVGPYITRNHTFLYAFVAFGLPMVHGSQKTVRFSEQIMSADKYPSIFSRQMETIVYIIISTVNMTPDYIIVNFGTL